MALRAIPNFHVLRPADAQETAACFQLALQTMHTPSALLLTRQGVPVSEMHIDAIVAGVQKGGYVVKENAEHPELIFLATGSEVSLALEVADLMNDKRIRVVSMPCMKLFDQQPAEYKSQIIPERGCMKISMEAGITHGWEKYIGRYGLSIGINQFGSSAPAADLAEKFGFTCDKVIEKINKSLGSLL